MRNKQEFLAAPGCWQLHCGEPASGPPASALCSVHTSAIQHQWMFQKHLATARYKLQCPPWTHFPALIQKHNGVTKAKIFLSVFSHHHSEHRINVSLDYFTLECLVLKIAVWVSFWKSLNVFQLGIWMEFPTTPEMSLNIRLPLCIRWTYTKQLSKLKILSPIPRSIKSSAKR